MKGGDDVASVPPFPSCFMAFNHSNDHSIALLSPNRLETDTVTMVTITRPSNRQCGFFFPEETVRSLAPFLRIFLIIFFTS